MSALQNFLAPFSHLLFANRNVVIVVLCIVLFWVAVEALIHRWRADRLERDLSTARSTPSAGMGRRYVTNAPVEEQSMEGGALPPVKGGRTYARNLGSALQKAGMSSSPIYSPPTPPGWAPNINPGQASGPQPGMAQPYGAPNVPWAAPAQPAASPWAYPAGRGTPGPAAPVPFYQPQPSAQPLGPPQPPTPAAMPGMYAPPAAPQYGQPAFPQTSSGPAAPAPHFAPPGAPAGGPMAPAFPGPVPAEPAAGEPAAPDGARRGKPKRRRFNFNVLENLEKMVQSKPAEPPPSTGWTPPAPSTAWTPPAAPTPGPSAPAATSTPAPPLPSAATTSPQHVPAVAEASAATKEEQEAPTLPFEFGPPVEAQPAAAAQTAAEPEQPASMQEEPEQPAGVQADSEPTTVSSEPAAQGAEPQAEPEPEPKIEARRSMRSMLFGEESAPVAKTEPTAEPVPAEPEPASSAGWRSDPWADRAEDSSSASEPEAATEQVPAAEEQPAETTPEPEPVAESTTEPHDPWKPARASETDAASEHESTPELVASAPTEAEIPETPVTDNGEKPSAGTVVIIEDDATAASYYATLFRGNGYRVEVANDGVSGVDLCARVQPQVILLDVMMPRQNGILVLQTLRASDETKNTPVVVMSNFSEPTLIKRALQLGALEYVIKTQVEGPALLNAVPRWMNREKAFAAA